METSFGDVDNTTKSRVKTNRENLNDTQTSVVLWILSPLFLLNQLLDSTNQLNEGSNRGTPF